MHISIHCVITLRTNTFTHLIQTTSYYQFSNALSANGMEATHVFDYNLDRLCACFFDIHFSPFSFRVFD